MVHVAATIVVRTIPTGSEVQADSVLYVDSWSFGDASALGWTTLRALIEFDAYVVAASFN